MAVKITRSQSRIYRLASEGFPTEYRKLEGSGKIVEGQWLRVVDTATDYIYYNGTWYAQ